MQNKGGRPKLKLKGKDLILHEKELKKRRDAKYHLRRKNRELSNPLALEIANDEIKKT